MTLKERALYHQIHPLKLTADIGCEPVSLYLFWHHDLALGLATHFAPPLAASLILIRCADFEAIKRSRAGAYLRRNITKIGEGFRFAGDMVMVLGAWFHWPPLIIAGLVVILIAWSSGGIRQKVPAVVVARWVAFAPDRDAPLTQSTDDLERIVYDEANLPQNVNRHPRSLRNRLKNGRTSA
jgi:hypothetical protein